LNSVLVLNLLFWLQKVLNLLRLNFNKINLLLRNKNKCVEALMTRK